MLPGPERNKKIKSHFDDLTKHRNNTEDFHRLSSNFLRNTIYSLLGSRKEGFLQLVALQNGCVSVSDQQLISLIVTNPDFMYKLFINFLNNKIDVDNKRSNGKQSAGEH